MGDPYRQRYRCIQGEGPGASWGQGGCASFPNAVLRAGLCGYFCRQGWLPRHATNPSTFLSCNMSMFSPRRHPAPAGALKSPQQLGPCHLPPSCSISPLSQLPGELLETLFLHGHPSTLARILSYRLQSKDGAPGDAAGQECPEDQGLGSNPGSGTSRPP